MSKFFDEVWAIVRGKNKQYSAKRFGIVLVLTVAALFVLGKWSAVSIVTWKANPAATGLPLTVSWQAIGGALIFLLMMLGLQLNGRIGGALIDERNLMSLSRFQLASWTVLVVSAFLAIALVRAFRGVPDALKIDIPSELWQLLGITSVSAVGRELVHASKKTKNMPNAEVLNARAAASINALRAKDKPEDALPEVKPEDVDKNRAGTLFRNEKPEDANLVNLFQGDEVGNVGMVDMSKVQMFFFTIACLVAYASSVWKMLFAQFDPAALTGLPTIGPGLLTILMISHATYLGNKTLDHSSATPGETAMLEAKKKA